MESAPIPAIGRIVHYVMPDGQHRPAIVVRVWPDGYCNCQVFVDGSNDNRHTIQSTSDAPGESLWVTSVKLDDEMAPGTVHWPER